MVGKSSEVAVQPSSRLILDPGISFQYADEQLDDVEQIQNATGPVELSIDGKAVRYPPGPQGLPYVGYAWRSG